MSDATYFHQRAETEARMADLARVPQVRLIHEELRSAYLQRAKAVGYAAPPSR